MNNSEKSVDIIIVGSGAIAMTCAAFCRFQNLSYQLLVPRETSNLRNRHFSITPTTEAIFNKLSLWNKIDERLYGFFDSIKILDNQGNATLSFNNLKSVSGPMSWVVKEDLITKLLTEKAFEEKAFFDVGKILSNNKNGVTLVDNGKTYKANLLLITENLNLMGDYPYEIRHGIRKYNQKALVGDLITEKPHENVALQWFTKDGILALLPMREINRYSVVYSQSRNMKSSAEGLDMSFLPIDLLNKQVSGILSFDNTSSYELIERWRTSVHDQSVVWLGGAAFSFHPLAGQGLNFGVKNVNRLFGLFGSNEKINDPAKKQKCLTNFNKQVISDATKLIGFINITKNFFHMNSADCKNRYKYILKFIDNSPLIKSMAVKAAI